VGYRLENHKQMFLIPVDYHRWIVGDDVWEARMILGVVAVE
jgi:hypothetical protein